MTLLESITEILRRSSQPYEAGRFVVVPTLLSYDNGKIVQTYIEGGGDTFIVSDGGAAADSFVSLGGRAHTALRQVGAVASGFGLTVSPSGWIRSAPVPAAHLPTFVALVAECSLEADTGLRKTLKRHLEGRDFKEDVNMQLRSEMSKPVVRRKHLVGASNKQHVFDFAVLLSFEKTLIMDAVVPEPNAINSAVVAHLDVRQSGNPDVVQLIVYDDRSKWTGADLSLLGVGAPTIPFRSLHDHLNRLPI